MKHNKDMCGSCGQTNWREASTDEYAAMTARMRAVEPEVDSPAELLVCRGCGTTRVRLAQTFGTSNASR